LLSYNRATATFGEVSGFVLTQQQPTDGAADTSQRFDVQLFIVHPTLAPAEISSALGLDAHFSHPVGEHRRTPKGRLLSGVNADTRWRHRVRHTVTGQWYAAQVTSLVDRLEPHKAFFADLQSTGGTACIIIAFLGDDGYFRDEIPTTTLAKLVDLKLALAVECFTVPQS
jgi:Domain of unknown function (DUF4279)